ncbi:hypothetical protein AHiyo8_61000 [Arthrobacter sp. Hiyo8]|nr:hypothetical protein AHiyo8_61000 [Arthrobacter sp. Hiyo8]
MPGSIAGPATFLAHMDITPENVVFRDGTAVALIDFDLLRPATRAEEVANLLLWWGAWMPVTDRDPVMRGVDAASRAAMLVDAYGLGRPIGQDCWRNPERRRALLACDAAQGACPGRRVETDVGRGHRGQDSSPPSVASRKRRSSPRRNNVTWP